MQQQADDLQANTRANSGDDQKLKPTTKDIPAEKETMYRRCHSEATFEKLRARLPSQRSVFSEKTVVVSIHNLLAAPLEVFWVDYEGIDRYFCTVPASHRMMVESFATHLWKVICAEYDLERTYHVTSHPKQLCVIRTLETPQESAAPRDEATENSVPIVETIGEPEKVEPAQEKRIYDPKRCAECDKKLKITNTHTCRCELNFCSNHRYAEEHQCTYDYRADGHNRLVCENPVVKGDSFRGERL
eukprot:GEMP01011442.1.p1 GENE.GEMP01011442.1~~GEMP01011442.1.p1  ORF type:complete len:245 (+),score=52.73 GEMP01011442.1:79-813(+)